MANKSIKAALFDFDGVLVDTEKLYDVFWNEMGERHHVGIPAFASVIKGSTIYGIIEKYFSDRTEEEKKQIFDESNQYDRTMPMPALPGSFEFVRMLKAQGVQVGLVTSSDNAKLAHAFHEQPVMNGLFDTIVSADRITQGKPNPMCYLLAAEDLNRKPEECLVFEDSFTGIRAGNDAGMRVIALSTTNPAEKLQDKAYRVIPNLEHCTFEDYLDWQA